MKPIVIMSSLFKNDEIKTMGGHWIYVQVYFGNLTPGIHFNTPKIDS